jgi:hypothetical protein
LPRPKTKEELIEVSTVNFHRLIEYIEQFSQTDQEKEFREGTMNRRIRDVLCHLHHWHLLMLDWYREGMNGNKPSMPAEGYTWKTTPALNLWIFESYQETSLEESKYLVKKGFSNLQKLIVSHSNEELFTKKLYSWTGTTSLGSYLISATSSHYEWAYHLIKKGMKTS